MSFDASVLSSAYFSTSLAARGGLSMGFQVLNGRRALYRAWPS